MDRRALAERRDEVWYYVGWVGKGPIYWSGLRDEEDTRYLGDLTLEERIQLVAGNSEDRVTHDLSRTHAAHFTNGFLHVEKLDHPAAPESGDTNAPPVVVRLHHAKGGNRGLLEVQNGMGTVNRADGYWYPVPMAPHSATNGDFFHCTD